MNYRTLLKREMKNRQAKNPRYSLRSFAKTLAMSPSFLSDVLSGKANLSIAKASELATRLKLNPALELDFCKSVLMGGKTCSEPEVDAFDSISLETFRLIADWKCMAAFELLRLNGQLETPEIARALGITTGECKSILDRLQLLSLIKKSESGWTPLKPRLATPSGCASEAIRLYHKGVIKHGLKTLDTHPVHDREFHSLLLVFAKDRQSAAITKIKEFIAAFEAEFNTEIGPDSVNALCVQFFPVLEGNPNTIRNAN